MNLFMFKAKDRIRWFKVVKAAPPLFLFFWVLITCVEGADFSFKGTDVTSYGTVQFFNFTVSSPGQAGIRSYGFSGGVNSAGEVIGHESGFTPVVALFSASGNLLRQAEDFGGYPWVLGAGPGSYTLALTARPNHALGSKLGDGWHAEQTIPPPFTEPGNWWLDIFGADQAEFTHTYIPEYPPPPHRTFAIVIGSDAPAWNVNGTEFPHAVRGDLDADHVVERLAQWDFNLSPSVIQLNYDYYQPDTFAADVGAAIADVADRANPGDSLLFFYSGHGSGGSQFEVQDALNPVDGGSFLDGTLTGFLADPRLSDVSKFVLLDSCHSGGFWSNDSANDMDLETLSNIAIISAATEDGLALADVDGTGFFTNAILDALTPDATLASLWSAAEGANANGDQVTGFFKDQGFGTATWMPISYTSADFDMDATIGGLPAISPELAGDYNQNGIVDAADYTVWRDNLGSGTTLPNDITLGVRPDDYTRWKTNFGQIADSGSGANANTAVPEPSTAAIILVAMLAMFAHRRAVVS